ncbi:hypothetical protein [Aulosira sp. FACHB-615]|uniref:hypothetical protein n=1 Tax=Aulosira sp. FACHB-615 TaxID=2692777 RepID=UPI00168662D8|nr:hypothetical protein [Aulosira sp. FACHB-615]MBD2492615.1 hypothetical protein [Aulosira sp. FACHB-615]
MFISDDRLKALAEDNCFLEGEKTYLIRLLRELRFFTEHIERSPISICCHILDAIVCLRLIELR